jgi:hypothetical protein
MQVNFGTKVMQRPLPHLESQAEPIRRVCLWRDESPR